MFTFVWGSCRVEVRFSCFALLAFCCIFTGMFSARESLVRMALQIIWIGILWALGALAGKKAFGVISMYGG